MGGLPDQVEIKISFGLDEVPRALAAFELDDDSATEGEIWFCELVESPGAKPTLLGHDLIVRLRQRPDHKSDSTVKRRGKQAPTLPAWWEPDDDCKYEGDWAGTSHQLSASVSKKVDHDILSRLSDRPLWAMADKLFNDHQRDFAQAAITGQVLDLGSVRPLGPIHARTWKAERRTGHAEPIAAEQWSVDDRGFLELSVRVDYPEAQGAQGRFTEFVRSHHFDPDALQKTKTAAILSYLAGRAVTPAQ
jgi:hypothetical protein